jgi:NADPH-dependent 2,4-dienoyl-CoA reductase/sulfur reductase-like enzyme
MKHYKYIIIGGGIAGGSAVAGIRQVDEGGSLALVTQEAHQPYERPPLSKGFLQGEAGLKRVYLQAEDYFDNQNADLLVATRVTGLDPTERLITLEGGNELKYEKLLLATGGRAWRLPIQGNDLPGVFTLRTIADSENIRAAAGKEKQALVLGGSFIGSEVSATLAQLGCRVTMVFPEHRLLERIVPEELSEYLHAKYKDHQVNILPGTTPKKLDGQDKVERALLDSGETLDTDLVVMGVGIRLNTELAQDTGLDIREDDNAILVDENLRTSDPHIFAAGDIAAWPDSTFEKRLRVEHWDVARRQGLRAGRNIAGDIEPYNALPYFFSDLFDLTFDVWGDLSKWERTVLRGSLEEGRFAYYYFNQDRLIGVLAVDRPDTERVPMQTLVKARPDYNEVADGLQDEDSDLAKLAKKLSNEGQPPSKEKEKKGMKDLSFAEDIRPLFREKDVEEMIDISDFDLSDYEDVKQWAESIYARIEDGSMPCDGAWSEEKLDRFKQWMDQGMNP